MATQLETIKKNGGNFQSSGLRQKIDQLMDILWAGGLNNPMDAIEQLSYMIFLRLLWEKDEILVALDKRYMRIFSGSWAKYGWGNFVTLTGDELFDSLRGALEKLSELPGLSYTGKLLFNRATLKIYDRPTLRAVVQGIAGLDLVVHNGADLKGDMYEYLLSKLAMSGTNGQFRTPRHIIDMIVGLVQPQPGERICDPACGTAGFLIAAFNYILRTHTSKASLRQWELNGDLLKPQQWKYLEQQAFTGYDNDANMVKIAILNLYLHQLERANVEFYNPLTTGKGGQYPGQLFDVILANPPFSGKIQQESILADLNHKLNTRSTELLFLKWFIDHLTPGGRAGVIVPTGVLFGSTGAAQTLRRTLLDNCDLQAVITMPAGVFKPYAGVATAVLVFKKGDRTKSVWFYEMTADGFSLGDTRTPVEENDIPDILQKWPRREEGVHSFRIGREELAKYADELTPGRYREQKLDVTDHDSPAEIIRDILQAEEEIADRLRDLRKELAKK
jgi:type I restriction enzyme M protein